MSDVRVCKRCKKLFQGYRIECCPICEEEIDDIFEDARDYIYKHPNANMLTVASALEVKEDDILYLVRMGRLSFSSAEGSGIYCERCNKPVASGRVCDACQQSVYKVFGDMAAKDAKATAAALAAAAKKASVEKGASYLGDVAKR